jgi:hypothetical protein
MHQQPAHCARKRETCCWLMRCLRFAEANMRSSVASSPTGAAKMK